jgi:hypothetical protein
MGVRVEVISFRGNTSSDLMDVADQFTEITSLAKVEKGSSRSGRRVAGDDEDLSMTEVPDKQTEGTGVGRGRTGRGRERTRREAEPVARSTRPRREAAAVTSSGAPLVVLPGEKLSRVVPAEAAPVALVGGEDEDELATGDSAAFDGDGVETAEGAERRRRRRRGGRGRGRGRGRDAMDAGDGDVEAAQPVAGSAPDDDDLEAPYVAAPSGPRTTPFGSVWDSQLGVPQSAPAARTTTAPLGDDDDFDEPEIPEYLIAERNRNRGGGGGGRGQGGGARGGRGVRAGYAAAVDRERYGRGGGSGGINRYPDVSGRERQQPGGFGRPARPERQERRDRPPVAPRSGGGEWSEVPPEIEEMLRAQLSSGRPGGDPGRRPAAVQQAAAAPPSPVEAPEVVEPSPARRPTTRRRTATAADATPIETAPTADGGDASEAAPKRRTTRKATTKVPAASAATAEGEVVAPAKRRTTRRTAAAATNDAAAADAAAGLAADAAPADADGAAPKRRTTRRKQTAEPTAD